MTFAAACAHITNYSAAHESRSGLVGDERVAYPQRHIEIDNRLAWFLGRLERSYGDDAFYVHLRRDDRATAQSFLQRYDTGIIHAYRSQIIMNVDVAADPMQLCLDYCRTVNENIDAFLSTKSNKMLFQLENADRDFQVFWDRVGAQGDFSMATREWSSKRNATESSQSEAVCGLHENPPTPSLSSRAAAFVADRLRHPRK
jgi:hypothetical protein